MNTIAVVVPTNRPEAYADFLVRWGEQFAAHNVTLIQVLDGDRPTVRENGVETDFPFDPTLIPNHCAGVRNMGFQYVAERLPHIEYIVTLDDDMSPHGDTIGDHIAVLTSRLPQSWFSPANGAYMRGFPYGVRNETEVVLSHGVWLENPDWDAPTQLVNGNRPHSNFYKGLIPKGVFFPFCGMNVAFKRKALPLVYYAPVNTLRGAERFDDIFAGIAFKPEFDELGWGIASGYAQCVHTRASNVLMNLEKEAVGIRLNETYWRGDESNPWFKEFRAKRERWKTNMQRYV